MLSLIVGESGFVRWWGVIIPKRIWRAGLELIGLVGDVFAIQAMSHHLGEAIFQDPTWQGRLIGIFIRLIRIIIGLFGEAMVFLFLAVTLSLWYVLPFFFIFEVIK